jgi:hypothetical protein
MCYNFTHAQPSNYCWNFPNTTTTDWRVAGSLNTWNWTTQGLAHPVYLQNDMNNYSFLMELPYFCGQAVGTGGCGNLNTQQYLYIQPLEQDIKPEDGWELVVKNFGTPNSTPNAHDGHRVDNPFFVLYNRYTGRMKAYFAVIGNTIANSAYIRIYFDETKLNRATLAHAVPVSNTLRDFKNQLDFKTFNYYAVTNQSTAYYWMVSDIQTAYDPCTCSLNGLPSKNSTIIIEPVTVGTSLLQADIEGQFTQTISNNGGVSATDDGKSAFSGDPLTVLKDAGQAAIKGYTDWEGYKNQYNGMVDKWNTDYKNKVVKDWFDEYVKTHPQYQGISGLNDKFTLWDNLGRTDDEFKKSIGIKNLDTYEQNSDWYALKSVAGYLPYVGTAVGIIDFFMNGGKEGTVPKPSPPMVFNVSLKMKGTITLETPKYNASFLTPGSPTLSAQASLQPYYNNILGVFNLLKTPILQMAEIKPIIQPHHINVSNNTEILTGFLSDGSDNANAFISTSETLKNTTFFKQYRLNDELKYLVNPAANVTVDMIDACFVIEYNDENGINFTINKSISNNLQNNLSLPFHNGIFNSSLSFSDRLSQIEHTGIELEYISKDNKTLRFRTNYVPLTCLKNQSFLLFNGKQPKVYVKLLIKYTRNDGISPVTNIVSSGQVVASESLTQIVTYDISSSLSNLVSTSTTCKIPVDKDNLFKDVSVMPGNTAFVGTFLDINISNQTLNNVSCLPFNNISYPDVSYTTGMANTNGSSNIYGTLTIPNNAVLSNNTYLKAQKFIIGDNVLFGNNVELVSRDDIELNPSNILSPTTTLRIENVNNLTLWQCPNISVNTLKATDAEILAVCSDNTYKSSVNTLSKTEQNITIISNQNTMPELNMNLKPNPTMYSTILSFNSDENRKYYISVTDIMGKEYWDGIEYSSELAGEQNININTSELLDGIYFIKLSTLNGYSETKKLVVIK